MNYKITTLKYAAKCYMVYEHIQFLWYIDPPIRIYANYMYLHPDLDAMAVDAFMQSLAECNLYIFHLSVWSVVSFTKWTRKSPWEFWLHEVMVHWGC